MCDEYVQGSNPLSPIVTIKLQKKKGSRHNVYIKCNGTMFQIFGECLPTQLRQPNIRLVTFSSSTHRNPKDQKQSSTIQMQHYSEVNTNLLACILSKWGYHT